MNKFFSFLLIFIFSFSFSGCNLNNYVNSLHTPPEIQIDNIQPRLRINYVSNNASTFINTNKNKIETVNLIIEAQISISKYEDDKNLISQIELNDIELNNLQNNPKLIFPKPIQADQTNWYYESFETLIDPSQMLIEGNSKIFKVVENAETKFNDEISREGGILTFRIIYNDLAEIKEGEYFYAGADLLQEFNIDPYWFNNEIKLNLVAKFSDGQIRSKTLQIPIRAEIITGTEYKKYYINELF